MNAVVLGTVRPGHLENHRSGDAQPGCAGSRSRQNINNGAISNFSLDNFHNGVKTHEYLNAPAGLIYPGDPGSRPATPG